MNIIVDEGQNMMDVALQYLGDMSGVFDLANANGISITELLAPGDQLVLPAAINTGAAEYFEERAIVIATDDNDSVAQKPGGINYMEIEFDFIVR